MQATTATLRAGRPARSPGNSATHASLAASMRSISDTRSSSSPCARTLAATAAVGRGRDRPGWAGADGRGTPGGGGGAAAAAGGGGGALAEAHGRVLAQDVVARSRCPASTTRRWTATPPAGPTSPPPPRRPVRLPVADDIPAGRTDVRPLEPGTVQRIMTGAMLPAGTDVIVPVELTDGGTDVVRSAPRRRPAPTCGTRARTSPPASWRSPAGTALGAAQLGLAAAVGVAPCGCAAGRGCWCSPPAASWSSPGEPLEPGQIYESNSALLAAAVERPAARAGGCTSSPTTSTSSSPRSGPSSPAPTCW